jgi:4-diphosphocytidyl-2-C-methyl-D-erythritol kinase
MFTEIAPAKINLFLDVVRRREDGNHDLFSCMQTVGLCDTVAADLREGEGQTISLTCTDASLPCGEKNLAYRAARLFMEKAGPANADLRLHIEKRIPVSAGLGGGSADAAATLRLLNRAYGMPLSDTELCALGTQLGADVPFCITGGTCRCAGIGDVLEPVGGRPDYTVLIAKKGESMSTKEAFGLLDERFGDFSAHVPQDPEAVYEALRCGDVRRLASCVYNIFEEVVLPVRPHAGELKDVMLRCGALCAQMSGSGPSVFGIFRSDARAELCAAALRRQGIFAAVCRTVG